MSTRPTYLDHAATTPLDARVAGLINRLLLEEFGNAGSRTHRWGTEAKQLVEVARAQVAGVVAAEPREVIFVSGATEANNLAILGLESFGQSSGRRHIVSTAIEHNAVLEPLAEMERRGFEVSLVKAGTTGRVSTSDIMRAVRSDTLLVSVMHVNNETGMIQPIDELAEALEGHSAFLHTDAAQGFGKDLQPLRHKRIDFISVSGHKIYGPKGVGALIARYRRFKRPPLKPLMFGGGQEAGLRPGTLPVPLIAGFGMAAQLCEAEASERASACASVGTRVKEFLISVGFELIGNDEFRVPHIVAAAHPHLDSEASMLLLREVVAISNGAACSSAKYAPSHVYASVASEPDEAERIIRLSWGPMTAFDQRLCALAEETLLRSSNDKPAT